MRVLLVGSGGREHAMARALGSAEDCEIFTAPGNPGTAAQGRNVAVAADDIGGLAQLVRSEAIELVIPGPEGSLCAGLIDELQSSTAALGCGPGRAAARLEASKAFTRALAHELQLPGPAYRVVANENELARSLRTFAEPPVVKADGLCAGKGVFLPDSFTDCAAKASQLLRGALGEAGRRVVLEQRLAGVEASLFFACHGEQCVPLPHARDYKRLRDGDAGPNTGGMGAVSPHPLVNNALIDQVVESMVRPTLHELFRRSTPFVGFLFVGVMLTAQGPQLLEFNVRLGDPEAQVVLPRLGAGEFLRLSLATARGELNGFRLAIAPQPTCAVVLASGGYPERSTPGATIALDPALTTAQRSFIHAGTAEIAGNLQVSGGRVGAIVAQGEDAATARARAYNGLTKVHFSGMQYRHDIGAD